MTTVVDLRSDTLTTPTAAMRAAMADARVGDEQRGEDPTVNELCEFVADRLGKEAGVFLPSCTMGNQLSILVHCPRGNVLLADHTAHVLRYEAGAPAALAGALVHPLQGDRGVFTADAVRQAVPQASRWTPRVSLVSIEQTSTDGGGRVWPLEAVRSVGSAARDLGMAIHIDGARMMNAEVASGVAARAYAEAADSVVIDLSKGLGCPIGAVLTGSKPFIAEAWRWKQRLGGAMRQAGILAAAGLYALRHNIARLQEDHANASRLAQGIASAAGLRLQPADVETNIVIFDVADTGVTAAEFSERLLSLGVHIGIHDQYLLRAVTYLGVTHSQIDAAVEAIHRVARSSR
jgi:threonine aldolase